MMHGQKNIKLLIKTST